MRPEARFWRPLSCASQYCLPLESTGGLKFSTLLPPPSFMSQSGFRQGFSALALLAHRAQSPIVGLSCRMLSRIPGLNLSVSSSTHSHQAKCPNVPWGQNCNVPTFLEGEDLNCYKLSLQCELICALKGI
jgi:hypothetical protein